MKLLLYVLAFITAVQSAVAFVPSMSRIVGLSSSSSRRRKQARNSAQTDSGGGYGSRRYRTLRTVPSAAASGESSDGPTAGTVGVIVCDHGSRREQANDMLVEVAERYRSFTACDVVEPAHMEMAEPSIEQAFDKCVAAGVSKVVLHPFFLSPGRHVTSDIPALMRAAAARHPKVAWVVSEPLGLQELMPRVMHAAVEESVAAGPWRHGGGKDAA